MAIDWDVEVLGPVMAEFGEQITYMPQSGAAFTLIDAVFDQAYQSLVLLENGPPVTTESPVLGVRVAEFPSAAPPRKGDTVAIPSVAMVFKVKEVHLDGHGHAKLMLNELRAM
ncbi:MAG: hypothetical protein KGI37_07730 [Alphaproteobacteria bacterium]|nr:hypothetical protein [Alphaproteobacteria bacterium]